MALKIWGTDPEAQPKPRQRFADDVVGRFRSGHQLGGQPASLDEWRVTTGDPEVADKVYELLGGDAPQSWETKGEDNLEVFTAVPEVEIILADPKALRQRMVLWSRQGKLVIDSDGETYADGTPDPDAELTFAERKKKGQDGLGPSPQIEVYFRLAAEPDLGIFKYQTSSWSLASDLVRNQTEEELAEIDGPTLATIGIEEVSFVAKNGPRKGQTVTYNKPVLTIKGAAPASESTDEPAAA
jgi:hypothetical protein